MSAKRGPIGRGLRRALLAVGMAVALAGTVLAVLGWQTEREIDGHRAQLRAAAVAPVAPPPAALGSLPLPVQRWVAYTFRARTAPPGPALVEVEMRGRFRRPGTTGFEPTTARQLATVGTPGLVFDATTPLVPGVWARAWDAYVNGRMAMKARVMSALTVVDESSAPALDQQSLRRWLLESSFYPAALLPGGPVHWEAVDAHRARAVAHLGGVDATLLATFADDGRLLQFDAEAPGDLGTRWHGSGERVTRDDYRERDGVMIPHRFVVSRVGGGRVWPFWDGQLTALRRWPPAAVPRP